MAWCWSHQAIARTNVYLSSIRSGGIHLMAMFRGNTKDIIHKNMFESFIFRITATSVRQQWVDCGQTLESNRLLRFTLKDHINIPICTISIIAVDDLAIQGSRASPAMTLTQLASRYSRPCTVCITMTLWWARWRLKSPASRLFTQPFIQTQIKENIKAPHHWPLFREFTGDQWIPRTKGQ